MDSEIVFRALADRTRQRLLRLLHAQELSVSELVAVLGQPQSTVSRHLRVLREAGLIRDRRAGAAVMYRVVTGPAKSPPTGSMPSAHAAALDNGQDLPRQILDWVAGQELPATLRARLAGVIDARGDVSRKFFDHVAREWDALREEHFGPCFHLEAFLSLLPPAWTVLDVGSGTGYLLPALGRQFAHVLAVEPVESMLGVSRQRVQGRGLSNIDLRQGDLTALPIAAGAVDLAIAVLVLHHVPSPREALGELYRVVRPGGRLLVVEQAAHENAVFRERMQDQWWGFEPGEFLEMTRSAGFSDAVSRPLATLVRADDAPELFVMTATKKS